MDKSEIRKIRNCGTCHWWEGRHDSDPDLALTHGECWARPPTAIKGEDAEWPEVSRQRLCGQWEHFLGSAGGMVAKPAKAEAEDTTGEHTTGERGER